MAPEHKIWKRLVVRCCICVKQAAVNRKLEFQISRSKRCESSSGWGNCLFGFLSTANMACQWKITILVHPTHPWCMASLWEGIAAMQLLQKRLKAYSSVRIKTAVRLCFPQENFRVSVNGEDTSRGLPRQRDSCCWWCGLKLEGLKLWQPLSWLMHWGVNWKIIKAQMHCSCLRKHHFDRAATDSSSLTCIQGNNLWNTLTWFINFLCSKTIPTLVFSDYLHPYQAHGYKLVYWFLEDIRNSRYMFKEADGLLRTSTGFPLCKKFSFLVQEEFASSVFLPMLKVLLWILEIQERLVSSGSYWSQWGERGSL